MIEVNINRFPNTCLLYIHLLDFNLILRQNSSDIVQKFNYNTIVVDCSYNSTILLLEINLFNIKEHVVVFNEFLIIAYFHYFIPNVQA